MSTLPAFRPVSGVPAFPRLNSAATDAVPAADFRLTEARVAAATATGTIGVSTADPHLSVEQITSRFAAALRALA